MPWPSTWAYNDAIQNVRTSVSDEELRAGELARNSQGLPLLWSGNFADVYRVHCEQTGSTWAVKCFTRESPGLKERYREISAHLQRARLRFMVDFEFVEPGILVGGQSHPFLKMRWVEGLALNQFVQQYLDRPATLRQLLALWVRLAAGLEEAQIAHADLQHGNVVLVPLPEGRLALRLIDYDGMYVPALAGRRSGELGHPAYQHPQRLRQGIYSLEVDRFSHLAIYCAVHCLTVGKRELWSRFDNGDNLLFREVDFRSPERSQVFRELWALGETQARSLVGRLFLAAQRPLAETPLLVDILPNGSVVPLSGEQQRQVESALSGGAVVAQPSGVSSPQQVVSDERRPWWDSQRPPLPGAAAAVAGTAADAALGTQPTPGTTPRQHGAKALPLGARLVRGALHAPAAVFRWPDRVLRAVAGKENVIIHNFLRMLALVVLVGLVLGGVRMGSRWIENAMASKRPDLGKKQPPEQAKPRPKPPAEDIPVELGGGVTMELVRIPAGEFLMGSPNSDRDAGSDEKPQHQVRITEPFYLGKYEVTQQQWEAVMGSNPSRFRGPNNPVETVSWDDCQAFLAKLNEQQGGTGRRFRLPREAEWEYACRAGSSTRWSFGDDEASLGNYAWYDSNSGRSTHAVGQKTPNAWGLFDMHGNVWEWCSDWYGSGYYEQSPGDDPTGPSSGSGRVFRGGSWDSYAGYCRSANRIIYPPGYEYFNLGFRVSLEAVE